MISQPLRNALVGLLLFCCAGAALAADDVDLWRRIDRITWGATPAELQRAQAEGWKAYLDAQLKPAPGPPALPEPVQRRIDAMSISREKADEVYMRQAQRQREIRGLKGDERMRLTQEIRRTSRQRADEAVQRSALRALYSPNQLQEVMTAFWMNHFSIYGHKGRVGTFMADYEDQAIRPHALGKFRDLLGATVRSPAMLLFLDNVLNTSGKINENYARELMELHTLGVDSGYTQRDVQALARILTGVGVAAGPPRVRPALRDQVAQQGVFVFNPARHDYGDKTFLGRKIEGQGMEEVDRVLDILARHPATARHVSRKLARYFVSDTPSDALVKKMADTFTSTDGDIPSVLRTMFDSQEFTASLAQGKFKDASQFLYSALRLTYAGMPPIRNTKAVAMWLDRLGQAPGKRISPDGYPSGQSDWSGSSQMTTRFELARNVAASPRTYFRAGKDDDGPQLPPIPSLLETYGNGKPGPFTTLSPATQKVVRQARNVADANAYLLSSPEFMRH